MIPANLIINADDFGLDPRISGAIFRCAEEGLINSFSVMPFADPFHDDLLKTLVSRHPNIRVGAHLSLLGPAPSESDRHGSPVGTGLQEHPNHFRDFLVRYITGRYPADRIHAEWEAQIRFLGKYLGGPEKLAHLDSHQHIHVLPGIWPVARSLQVQFKIPRLRVPYESLRRALSIKFPFGLGLQFLARMRWTEDDARLLGFATSTRFTLEANQAGLRQVLAHPDRKFELMVHPAEVAASGSGSGSATTSPGSGASASHPDSNLHGYSLDAAQFQEVAELRRLRDFFGTA